MKFVSLLALLVTIVGCEPRDPNPSTSGQGGMGGETTVSSSSSSSGDAGMGGVGGMTVSSSSSSSGQPQCDILAQAEICEQCKAVGCEPADPQGDPCYYGAVYTYSDMIGCVQWPEPQAYCPACVGLSTGDPLPFECQSCAQPHTPCTLYCYQALGGTP